MPVGIAYAVMSVITFIAYVLDKRAAIKGRPRTPESTLHIFELLGGWPGAFAAQRFVRHKNAKLSFQILYWLIVALHVAAWVTWLKVA